MKNTPILNRINSPKDLKRLPLEVLPGLAREIRNLIMQVVSENGGHLASNLGVVELTLALHRVFDSPEDKIIWDVGHQCYTHKLITGRRDNFHSLRMLGGISGFPKHSESPHDIVDTGHSSTSISSGLGILIGQQLSGRQGKVIAVIGDGALTGGLALEALNHAGHLGKDLIVVLNDNNMSIGDNVGAISSHLSRLTATRLYQNFRKRFDRGVEQIPLMGSELNQLIFRLKKGMKALILKENLFPDLGFEYIGPIDGHNIRLLSHVFRNVKKLDKPVVVHVSTVKGKGYIPAEGNPTLYHGVAPFSIVDGKIEVKGVLTYTEVFSGIVVKLAKEDDKIVAITAAMADGTGLRLFQTLYPERFFDVGIAEQHAVTFASGLAISGRKPIVAVYSTFMQRAVDQVIQDVALPGLPVIFAVDRAGLVGSDGETHHGLADIPLFRAVPGLTILSPASRREMEIMFRYGLILKGPVMIRYPRAACGPEIKELSAPITPGRGVFVRRRVDYNRSSPDYARTMQSKVLILSLGGFLSEALSASDLLRNIKITADVYNFRFIKPIDEDYLVEIITRYDLACMCEEGFSQGGLGEMIAATLNKRKVNTGFIHLGIPDRFISHGTRKELLSIYGLKAHHIAAAVEEALESPSRFSLHKLPRINT